MGVSAPASNLSWGGVGRWEGRSVLSAPSTRLCKDHPSPKPCPPRLKMSFTQQEYGGPALGWTALGSECTERDQQGRGRQTDHGTEVQLGEQGQCEPAEKLALDLSVLFCVCFNGASVSGCTRGPSDYAAPRVFHLMIIGHPDKTVDEAPILFCLSYPMSIMT